MVRVPAAGSDSTSKQGLRCGGVRDEGVCAPGFGRRHAMNDNYRRARHGHQQDPRGRRHEHRPVEKVASERPDLIFLDIIMEDMDGFQTCRKLSNEESSKHIPVIMVSSKDQKVDILWARRQGARAYIVKPYTADEITDQVQKLQ
jgi:PleD family two-component response regulator